MLESDTADQSDLFALKPYGFKDDNPLELTFLNKEMGRGVQELLHKFRSADDIKVVVALPPDPRQSKR